MKNKWKKAEMGDQACCTDTSCVEYSWAREGVTGKY